MNSATKILHGVEGRGRNRRWLFAGYRERYNPTRRFSPRHGPSPRRCSWYTAHVATALPDGLGWRTG